MKRRMLSVMPLLALLMLVSVKTASASSAPIPFHATAVGTGFSFGPKTWTDGEGGIHFRDATATGTISGDIEGNFIFTESGIMRFPPLYPSFWELQIKGLIYVDGEAAYTFSGVVRLSPEEVVSSSFVIDGIGSNTGIHITGKISAPAVGVSSLDGAKIGA